MKGRNKSIKSSDFRQSIRELCETQGMPITTSQAWRWMLSQGKNMSYSACASALCKLTDDCAVTRIQHGKYVYNALVPQLRQLSVSTDTQHLKDRIRVLEERSRTLAEAFNNAHSKLNASTETLAKIKKLYENKRDADNALTEALEAL